MFTNINSLRRKQQVVEELIYNNKLRILFLAETWIDDKFDTSLISVDNYHFVGNNRNLCANGQDNFIQGEGVGCYIHDLFLYKILDKSANTNINETEYLSLEISATFSTVKARFILSIIYRRPKSAVLSEFFLHLNKFAE